MKGFGQRLRELRGEKTQAEAAQAIGLKASSYSMYESGRREPGFETLVMIADHYGVSTDYLLGRTECQSPDIDVQAICKKTGLSEDAVSTLVELKENDVIYYDLQEGEEKPEAMFDDWKQRKHTFFKLVNVLLNFPVVTDYIYLCEDIERTVIFNGNAKATKSKEIAKHRAALPDHIKPYLVDPYSYTKYAEYEVFASLTELSKDLTEALQQEQGRGNNGETQSS